MRKSRKFYGLMVIEEKKQKTPFTPINAKYKVGDIITGSDGKKLKCVAIRSF